MNSNSRDKWYLDLALRTAQQSTCLRRRFGAIIVNREHHIIATGYNGAPSKCSECVTCVRDQLNVQSGERYELCRSVHAEQNALLQAGRSAHAAIIYIDGYDVKTGLTIPGEPCFLCTKMMINSGIEAVVVRNGNMIVQRTPRGLYKEWILRMGL